MRIRDSGTGAGALRSADLGVQDLMASVWGWRVLGQGVLLAGIVFLMAAIPMLNWFSSVTGPISTGLLPAHVVGAASRVALCRADGGVAHRAHDGPRAQPE